jgi:hypothetical protein
MAARYRTYTFNTSSVTGSSDTLNGAITASQTTITLASGAATVNGTQIQIGSERMLIVSGGGTPNLTVQRGYGGTTAAAQTSGATVQVPGSLTYSLLQVASILNQSFTFAKVSADIHYVKLVPAEGDSVPGGASAIILADTSAAYGAVLMQATGAGWLMLSGAGIGTTGAVSGLTTVTAANIVGEIQANQIASIEASQITGQIESNQIASVTASEIVGEIASSQINTVTASQITGTLTSTQIASVAATTISGTISASQIGSVAATSITGVIVSSQLENQIINSANLIATSGVFANGITNNGSTIGISPSGMTSGSWTASQIASVNSGTLVGLIVAGQINSISTSQLTGQIATTNLSGTITASQISSVYATDISTTYGGISASQISSVSASSINGSLSATQIGSVNASTINFNILLGPSDISSVNASQINTGTINVGSGGITFSGTGGIIVSSPYGTTTMQIVSSGALQFSGAIWCANLVAVNEIQSAAYFAYYGSTNLEVINSSGTFVGAGVSCPSYGIQALGFNPTGYDGQGTSASPIIIGFNGSSLTWNGSPVSGLMFVGGVLVGT